MKHSERAPGTQSLELTFGGSVRQTAGLEVRRLTWPELCDPFAQPHRSPETLSDFLALDPTQQRDLKDKPGIYIGGPCRGGRRRAEDLTSRSLLTLDADHVPAGIDLAATLRRGPLAGHAWLLHSTRKHSPESPRYRLLVPLATPITDQVEHEATARAVAAAITPGSLAWFDAAGFRWSQVCFLPSVCSGSQYVLEAGDGAGLDAADFRDAFYLGADWRDPATWPRLATETEAPRPPGRKPRDPATAPGLIGAWNRARDVYAVLDEFLADVYVPGSVPDRWTFARGTGADGAIVYDGGRFLFSHHEHDPCRGQLVNAWDLLRLHRFGELDREAAVGTPTHRLPSQRAMERFAAADRAAMAELGELDHAVGGDLEGVELDHAVGGDLEGRELDRVADGNLEGAVGGDLESAVAAGPPGLALSDFWHFGPGGGFHCLPTAELWPGSSLDARLPWIATGKTDTLGRERRQAPSRWLAKHRSIDQMLWAPGEPAIIEGRLLLDGAWVNRDGVRAINRYRPPVIVRGNAGEVAPWRDHLHAIYPEEAPHIEAWMAHRVQRPSEKVNHAICLFGPPGVGKDTILEPLKVAVGPWNWRECSPATLLGQFTDYAEAVVLRIVEAHDSGDANRYQIHERMKHLLASPPDVLMVNRKYLSPYAVANVVGVVITSNAIDSLHLEPDDRRHFVAWSPLSREEFDAEHFARLWHWYETGGMANVAAFLATKPLASFNPKAPPPRTAAFRRAVDAARSPMDAEMADALDAAGNPPAVTIPMLLQAVESIAARHGFGAWLTDPKNARLVGHRFRACGYEPVSSPAKSGLWRVDGQRCRVYARRELTLADQLAAAEALTRRGGAADGEGEPWQ